MESRGKVLQWWGFGIDWGTPYLIYEVCQNPRVQPARLSRKIVRGGSSQHRQGFFTLCCQAYDGPTLNACLVAMWFSRGSGPVLVLLRSPWGGGGGLSPELSLGFWKQEFRTPIWQKVGVPLEKVGVPLKKSWKSHQFVQTVYLIHFSRKWYIWIIFRSTDFNPLSINRLFLLIKQNILIYFFM